MIFYRVLGKYGRKSRWQQIDGATNLKQGVDFVLANIPQWRKRPDAETWEVGCKVPPKDTPQARRNGPIT